MRHGENAGPRLSLLTILLPMLLVGGGARAEFDLFGTRSQVPANPFASNYASPPVRGPEARMRRGSRPVIGQSQAPRPPRDIPR